MRLWNALVSLIWIVGTVLSAVSAQASDMTRLLGPALGSGAYRLLDPHWSADRCAREMDTAIPASDHDANLRQALCAVEAFLYCRSFVPGDCGGSLLHGLHGGDDQIAIHGSYAYDAFIRVPLDISLKRYRVIGLGIEDRKGAGFFAWVEVESEDCRGNGPRIRCGMLLTPGQASRREYFGFSDPGTEDHPRIRLWGPLRGANVDDVSQEGSLGLDARARSIEPSETMWRCLGNRVPSRPEAIRCALESMVACQELEELGRCAEVGWFKDGGASSNDDINALFGPAYFQEEDYDILRGIRRIGYRIIRFEPHYRGYPNLARVTVELRLCYLDEPEGQCHAAPFVRNKPVASYLVWFPPNPVPPNPWFPWVVDSFPG